MRKTYLKKVPFIIMIIWTCLLSFGYAQGLQEIKGTVRDSDGPLADVTITSISTGKSTKSDASGQFTIEAPLDSELKISLIGYQVSVVKITSQNLNVTLQKGDEQIDEVVVVSYGTQQKSKITGAIAEMDAAKAKDLPVGQFTQKLQGRIAGAQVTQVNGRPGQGMAVRIRGAASMNAGNTLCMLWMDKLLLGI